MLSANFGHFSAYVCILKRGEGGREILINKVVDLGNRGHAHMTCLDIVFQWDK